MRDLRVTLIQTELTWRDSSANIERFDAHISSIDQGSTDLVVLPEMFSTGFTMEPDSLAEDMDGRTVGRMRHWAAALRADVAGSVIIADDGRFYNRLVWVRPDGSLLTYDKRHLFRMAGEDKIYSAGEGRITVDIRGWKLRPFICYDLRFPVWTRNTRCEYDAAVFTANWPEKRAEHWKALLRARAIENQCYVVGVNRTGTDGNGISYGGDSTVIDFAGTILFEKGRDECIRTVELSYERLQEYRESFPAWRDSDAFDLS